MRLHIVSDLHEDIRGNAITSWTPPEADVIVVAGDAMAPGSHALRLLRRLYRDTSVPLIYVAGNHDFYSEGDQKILARDPTLKTTFAIERERLRAVAAELDIIFLDDASAQIGDVLFIGATLWTDFQLRPPHVMFGDAVRQAEKLMNDYRYIKTGEGRSRDRLRVRDTIAAHMASRMFIANELQNKGEMDAVVITHHAPSRRSLRGFDPADPADYSDLDWCYASDIEYLMMSEHAPLLWVHGHIHDSQDYLCGATRVVTNARGYPDLGRRENPQFNPNLVIEIEPRPTMSMRCF